MNMMRGGGNHRNKKNRAEKQKTASSKNQEPVRDQQEHEEKVNRETQGQQEPKQDKSLLSRESAEDEVVRHFEEAEGTRTIIADLSEGSNSDLEQWIQTYTELTGLDDEQKKTEANGMRRAVEARRKDPGKETTSAQEQLTTAAQEQGKDVCFMERRKRAQEGE